MLSASLRRVYEIREISTSIAKNRPSKKSEGVIALLNATHTESSAIATYGRCLVIRLTSSSYFCKHAASSGFVVSGRQRLLGAYACLRCSAVAKDQLGGTMHSSLARVHSLMVLGAVLFALLMSRLTAQAGITYQYDPDGRLTSVSAPGGAITYTYDAAGNLTNVQPGPPPPGTHAAFFNGEVYDGNGWYQLQLADGTFFGYYSDISYPVIYHIALGWESVFDANDGLRGVYFYDYGLQAFLYTNPSDFPYFYDFTLSSWLYYEPGTSRWFYNFGSSAWFFSAPG